MIQWLSNLGSKPEVIQLIVVTVVIMVGFLIVGGMIYFGFMHNRKNF